MADPLLTTLCTTCHSAPPRYRCPRCGARSCSLPCIRKHKSWASCTGIRDVTAFVPAAKLRTPAGIDHDYNFLTSIERARDRATRDIVQDRGLLLPGEALEGKWSERWKGDELSFRRPGAGGSGGETTDGESEGPVDDQRLSISTRGLRRAYRAANVEVEHMPTGMARAKENLTALNKRTRRIHWQVEWLFYEDGLSEKPTKMFRRCFDSDPIYRGFSAAMEWVLHGRDKASLKEEEEEDEGPPKKKRRGGHNRKGPKRGQFDSSWPATSYPLQNPVTRAWAPEIRPMTDAWEADYTAEQRRSLQYFLLVPRTTKPKQLIPIDATDSLQAALAGRSVLEFPTVYVLPAVPATNHKPELPPDHVLGSTERRPKTEQDEEDKPRPVSARGRGGSSQSRGARGGRGGRSGRGGRQALANGKIGSILKDRSRNQQSALPIAGKKRKVAFAGIQDLDDGEVNSDGEELGPRAVEDSDETSSSGSSILSSEAGESSGEEEQDGSGLFDVLEGLLEDAAEAEDTGKKPLVVYDSWSEDEGE